jgi:hypothetical protein
MGGGDGMTQTEKIRKLKAEIQRLETLNDELQAEAIALAQVRFALTSTHLMGFVGAINHLLSKPKYAEIGKIVYGLRKGMW